MNSPQKPSDLPHSVATVTAAALVAWWVLERGLGRLAVGRAVALGSSMLVLVGLFSSKPAVQTCLRTPAGTSTGASGELCNL